jgi:hypothetical protein
MCGCELVGVKMFAASRAPSLVLAPIPRCQTNLRKGSVVGWPRARLDGTVVPRLRDRRRYACKHQEHSKTPCPQLADDRI